MSMRELEQQLLELQDQYDVLEEESNSTIESLQSANQILYNDIETLNLEIDELELYVATGCNSENMNPFT